MSEDKDRSELDEFDTRLKQARSQSTAPRGLKAPSNEPPKGFGMAIRAGADMVSGIIVGVGIGYGLDTYVFDTKPWLMVLFFFLGSAAGMMNVFRTVQGIGMAVGYKNDTVSTTKPDEKSDD
jgi:ATP synthase protein I